LKGDHVFAPPYASRLSTFRAPGWGTPAILPPCRWRNATAWKLVPFSHRSASRIFIRQPGRTPSPVVTQDGDHQPLGGEKQVGLRPLSPPPLNFKDFHHPCWGGERGEPGLYLPHGSAGHLLFQLLVVETILQLCGGGVLQPCRGRRTVAAQLGCNIPSSSSLSWRGRERGPAGALWSGPHSPVRHWWRGGRRRQC
jgi:hypothetical protein